MRAVLPKSKEAAGLYPLSVSRVCSASEENTKRKALGSGATVAMGPRLFPPAQEVHGKLRS
jgi:hypothetical protein